MVIVLDPQLLFSSQVSACNTIYVITGAMDLGNSTLDDNLAFPMPANCTLRFAGGQLKNGVILGNNTRIDNPLNSVIFDNVELSTYVKTESAVNQPNDPNPIDFLTPIVTGWLGECRDLWFNYDESTKAHFSLVKSVCQFELCSLSSRTYYIEQWKTISLRPYGCIINGGGAKLILLRKDSYLSERTGWNDLDEYLPTCLFQKHAPNRYGEEYSSGEKAGLFSVSDLTILDNNTLKDVPSDWGEDFVSDINRNKFVFYAIFKGAGNQTVFRNVKYDGRGGLWAYYNYEVAIEQFDVINCDIKTSQFAFELGNVRQSNFSNRYPDGGSCKLFRISNSRIYNYAANVLVGPLSVVNQDDHRESTITDRVIIDNTVFESETIKNLELPGARAVHIHNCVFLSVFCCSESDIYLDELSEEHPINKTFHVIGNTFDISKNYVRDIDNTLRIEAGDIFFINNVVTVDFEVPGHPKGSFFLLGYGNNTAIVSGNTFILKNTYNEHFKSLLFYENTILDLIGNSYCFLEGVKQGYEVSVGGRGGFLHLEVEDDSRFSNTAVGGFFDWKAIPFDNRTPEGFLQKGASLTLSDDFSRDISYPYDPDDPNSHPVPLKSFEFDLRVHLNGLERNDAQTFVRFHAGSDIDGDDTYERYVNLESYYGTFRIRIDFDYGSYVTNQYYSSLSGVQMALPFLDFDTYGDSIGVIRVVFINETSDTVVAGETTITRVVLYLNDVQVDTFCLDVDVLTKGITGIILLGSNFVRIKNYRLRTQVKTLPKPFVADRVTEYPNIGYASSGLSADRPVSPEIGFTYFDTQLGKPVFFNGSIWVDANGNSVNPSV